MPRFSALPRVPLSLLLRQFAIIYAIATTIFTIAIIASTRLDRQEWLDRVKVREAARVEIARHSLTELFSAVASDLRLLAEIPSLRRYLDNGGTAQEAELANLFVHVATTTRRYDQVRYLDATGREIVRIDYAAGKATVVPRDQLQDKSGRYYFRDAIKLERDEIFVSPLDLNIEHDKLEIPYKPMIRIGMPVFDRAGHKRGIILLNYFGEDLLAHFRDAMHGGDKRVGMMLNGDGYWLSSPRHEDEWGFMLGKPERTFGHDFPEEWHTISASARGTLQTKNGLFVYDTVYPLEEGQSSSTGSPSPRSSSLHKLTEQEYYWKVVSYIPEEDISAAAQQEPTGSRLLFAVVYILLAVTSLALAFFNLSRSQARMRLQEDETRLREIAVTMSDGLLVADLEGKITFANPEACRLLGYGEAELIGVDMHAKLHAHDNGNTLQRDECRMLGVVQTGETYRAVEENFKRKDGQLLPISVSVSAIIRDQEAAGIVVAFHDITERKKFEQELEHRAQTDALTGLNNRRHFYELAELEIARSRRFGKPLAIMMVDVDHFKNINDTYGHHVGDAVLQILSGVCLQTLREIDIVGRLGGEEFAVLLPEATAAHAAEVAERLRIAIEKTAIPLEQGQTFSISVSIGVTGMNEPDRDIDAMLKRADAAMYDAKQAGRNRVRVRE